MYMAIIDNCKQNKLVLIALCATVASILTLLSSCNERNTANPYANDMGIAPASLAAIDTPNYTTITWLDSVANFGEIKPGDTAVIKFSFKNSGDKPLFITEVVPSCGCTIADYPKEMIRAGEQGVVTAKFISEKGYIGPVRKSIHISTNTKKSVRSTLIFFGHVIPINGSANEISIP